MEKKKFGIMQIIVGTRKETRGRPPLCQICEKQVVAGDRGVLIKALGEMPREHHYQCLLKVFNWLKEM
jgi:hypothetical protein